MYNMCYSLYWKKIEECPLSHEFKDLIQKMLSYDPTERPSIADIREHPWMNIEYPKELVKAEIYIKLCRDKGGP